MNTDRLHDRIPGRAAGRVTRWVDVAMRVLPATALIAVAAFFAAQQTVSPHHRAIKGLVLLALMALMFRFDMVNSVYLFTLLFVFPSGISVGSTNNVLMTVIPLIWAVRATSGKLPLMTRTILDAPIALFLLAHFVSLFNVGDTEALSRNVGVLWRQFSACAFFYLIVMFVNDEAKLFRMGKFMCVACGLVMLTAVLELFFPGATLVPGWIGLTNKLGEGQFSHRAQGLRVGGAFDSHGMLSDFGTQLILFMVFYALRAKNPLEKTLWVVNAAMTFIAILATANRGATAGLIIACVMAMVYFRKSIGTARVLMLGAVAVVGLVVADGLLSKHTIAVSVLDRFGATEFEGMVPDTRTMTWKPALEGAMEKPFFGHGPFYDTGEGLTRRYWPHNGYLFYFFTLGLLGLGAFVWIIVRVFRYSRVWRAPAVAGTPLGQFLALAQIWLVVLCVEQMRTDHQRDDIYPYIVWMCFGVVTAAATIARNTVREPSAPGPGAPR